MKARIILVSLLNVVHANNDDRFNYRETVGTDFGPEDWNQVSCSDIRECPGWPDGWELGVGWELERTNCEWCPEEGGNDCGQHRQSPIDLKRERSTTGHDPECYDYHWMVSKKKNLCDISYRETNLDDFLERRIKTAAASGMTL
jgi:hypothetical protein